MTQQQKLRRSKTPSAAAESATKERSYYVVVRWKDRESVERFHAIGPHAKRSEARDYAAMFQSTFDFQLEAARRSRITLNIDVVPSSQFSERSKRVWPDDTPVYNVLDAMFPNELRSRLWFAG